MQLYDIKYSKQAIQALRKMPRNISTRILEKIEYLATDPYDNQQVKLLKGVDSYRLRVGDWRVIYTIDNDEVAIWVIKIASRGEVYKQ